MQKIHICIYVLSPSHTFMVVALRFDTVQTVERRSATQRAVAPTAAYRECCTV